MCGVLSFTTFVQNIFHPKKKWKTFDKKMFIGLHVKNQIFLTDFNSYPVLSTDFSKNTQISDFMTIRPVGTELFHAEGRTSRRTDI